MASAKYGQTIITYITLDLASSEQSNSYLMSYQITLTINWSKNMCTFRFGNHVEGSRYDDEGKSRPAITRNITLVSPLLVKNIREGVSFIAIYLHKQKKVTASRMYMGINPPTKYTNICRVMNVGERNFPH